MHTYSLLQSRLRSLSPRYCGISKACVTGLSKTVDQTPEKQPRVSPLQHPTAHVQIRDRGWVIIRVGVRGIAPPRSRRISSPNQRIKGPTSPLLPDPPRVFVNTATARLLSGRFEAPQPYSPRRDRDRCRGGSGSTTSNRSTDGGYVPLELGTVTDLRRNLIKWGQQGHYQWKEAQPPEHTVPSR